MLSIFCFKIKFSILLLCSVFLIWINSLVKTCERRLSAVFLTIFLMEITKSKGPLSIFPQTAIFLETSLFLLRFFQVCTNLCQTLYICIHTQKKIASVIVLKTYKMYEITKTFFFTLKSFSIHICASHYLFSVNIILDCLTGLTLFIF